jgi:hypothetical protein
VVVVVALGLLLAGLAATGVLPWFKGTSSHPFAPTFQGAAAEGQPTANSVAGGPWGAAVGVALRIPLSVSVPTQNLTSGIPTSGGCNATIAPGLPADVVVQATPASTSPGTSAFWVVLYVNSSGGAVGLMVNGGVAAKLFSLGGSACANLLRSLVPFPSGAPDSPAVINAVNASGGSGFLAAHPGASELFVGASVVLLEPLWGVVYTTCTLTPFANTSGEQFNATVIGTTVENVSTGTVSCSLPAGVTFPALTARLGGIPAIGKAI